MNKGITRHDFFEIEKRLITALMNDYPWPWTITHDWRTEIHDANGRRFIDCYNPVEADHVLALGKKENESRIQCAIEVAEIIRLGHLPDDDQDT